LKILHTEWSEGWGGQEIRILADADILTRRGHQVTLLVRPGSGLEENARSKGLPVVVRRIKHAYDPASLIFIARLLRKERFQVVNTHSSVDSWVAGAAAKLAHTPALVRTRHLSVPVADHMFNVVYRWPDALVTTAEMIRRRLIEVNGFAPDRVASIPTGVDLDRFDPDLDPGEVRAELGLPPGGRVAAMVAVLRSWKRHEIFLEAAAKIAAEKDDVSFLVVGEGPRRPNIEAKIQELGLGGRVVLTGYRTDVPRILAACDVCALTSESSEGVPQSVLQYQAMARPVVGTAAGGIPEVIEDGVTGLLCPVNDAEAVAEAMTRLLDDPDLARRVGAAGRRRIERKHSLDAMADATLDLYRGIVQRKTGRLED
jgi:glycosyltransferase involved in cell wall biosynthesis